MRINQLREDNPLIICLTNDVVKNFTANGLLALGASPAMATEVEELEDFIQHAGAVLINIGSLTKEIMPSMEKAVEAANKHHVPVVLDPVACSATAFRKEFCLKLIDHYDISVIRGNASEVKGLIEDASMKGTDSDLSLDPVTIAKKAGTQFGMAVIVTGKEDGIYVDGETRRLLNGTEMLTKVTGGGCLLGAIVSAFIYNKVKPTLSDLVEAVAYYNVSAERAEALAKGTLPGHFQINLLDMLNSTGESDIAENMRVEEVD
ncbi:hydroxyethylthiazole kinase [Macrococcus carouselicus]|uniref:Hydroxyethylthiazole kinase n=1 Tax=Macrococcus carouselicus TaxID=69969 RepID=A0A9Q8CBD8_9STAP|nr:hydroxyethylthiazole kinase [Macrococcus carouselicus]TDL95382.1 hydroxyethylthiazole kinase [Macrococcus carouselicus]